RPGTSPSLSVTLICWCCREAVDPFRRRPRDARRPGVAPGHGALPRRPAHDRRRLAGRGGRARRADHAVLRVAPAARARRPRRRAVAAAGRRGARGRPRPRLRPGRAWAAVALASALVVAGHALTFLIAAHTAGVTASPARLLPLALLVLAGAALPNIGGWGPRE